MFNRITVFLSRLAPISVALGMIFFGTGQAFASAVTLTAPLDSRDATTKESNFGNLVTDSILQAAPGADFAIAPASEISPVLIPSGNTTTEHLAESLRASSDSQDTVVTVPLTGAEVIAALAHGASRSPGPFDGYLQVSGISVRYDNAKHGVARVITVTLLSRASALDSTATYTVAMPKYLANGSLGFFSVWPQSVAVKDTGVVVTKAVEAYVLAHNPLNEQVDGRIIR